MLDGWIRLHRKIRENPIFNDMELFRLWIICLTEATYKERDQMVGKQVAHLMPGDFVTGRFSLNELYNSGLGRKENKPPTTTWRWLETLEKNGLVVINSNNKYSVVSILKWADYQQSDDGNGQQIGQQVVNNLSTDGQQVVTNKNVKKDNNANKVKKETIYTPQFDEFWSLYPKPVEKVDCFATWQKIIKDGEAPEIIIQCAKNYGQYCLDEQTESRFIKHPKTFLNKQRYQEYLTAKLKVVHGGGNSGKYGRGNERTAPTNGFNKAELESLYVGSPQVRVQQV